MKDLEHKDGATVIAGYHWTFDELNRVQTFQTVGLHDNDTATYGYDQTSQLTSVTHTDPALTDKTYTYDAEGNRTGGGYVTDPNNRLKNDGTFTYEYDGEGNRTKRTRLSNGDVTRYTWDHRNRLTKIVDETAAGTVLKTVEYSYDAFNRRIEKKVDGNDTVLADGTFEKIEQYVYDGDHIALQFDGAGSLTNRYLHNPQHVDQVLADEQVTSLTSPGNVLWPLPDDLGSVRDLVDNNGNVANHLVYDAFGNIVDETNAAVDHIFGYTGRETDEESDLQYYRNRYYDSINGRFISEDPLGFAAGDENLSRYVANSPTNYTDPFGLDHTNDHSGGGDGGSSENGTIDSGDALEPLPPMLGPAPPEPSWCDLYGQYLLPWRNPSQSVDGIDTALKAGKAGGAIVGAGAGVAAVGVAAAGGSAIAVGIGTEIVDTAVEEGASAVFGVPVIIPVSPADILQDGGKLLGKRALKEAACPAPGSVPAGTQVTRNWGGNSGPFGESWTTDPIAVQSRNSLGLETTNTGEFISHGTVIENAGITTREARPWGRFAGGGQETLIPSAQTQVRLDAVTMPDKPLPWTRASDPRPLPTRSP